MPSVPIGLARRPVSSGILWAAFAFTVAAVIALATLNWRASQAYDAALTAETEGSRLLEHARNLDDQTTLTALLSVAVPGPEWPARYDSLDVETRRTLSRVQAVAGTSAPGAVARLRRADARMTALERTALQQAPASRARAEAILRGPEYALTKRLFDAARRDASTTIEATLDAHRAAAHRRAVISMAVALVTVLLLVAAWAGVILLLRQYLREQSRFAHQLREAKELAEAANRSKGEFLAGMSHELRTPLTAVIGFANILQKNRAGRLGATDLEYVTRIQRSGRHLLTLINEVLDLARLESRRVEIEYEAVELRALVEDAVALAVGRSEANETELRVELPPGVQWVETDRSKLTQVIINLVGNAVKFTGRGTVTVRLSAEEEAKDLVRLAVIDTGVGIPADRLDAIFQPFEQADNTTARRFGGTGLGLAISRTIATALGGTLRAASVAGAGSTFTLELPRRRAVPTSGVPAAIPASPPSSPPAPPGRRLVLVIDDDADARRIIAHQVEEAGADVILASSGEEGLRLARERRPDAITLDLVMPGLGGIEVLRRLKEDRDLSGIPVVIVSVAAADAGSLLGALDAVSKPLEPGALANALRRQIGPLDRASVEVLVVEDDAQVRDLLADHLRAAGAGEVRSASEGREALRLLDERTPDLIVLDLVLPGMGGISFLRALRLDIRWAHLPVIVVTGASTNDRDAALLHSEAVAVLRKGDDIGDRLTRVLRAVIPHGQRSMPESA